MQAVLPFALGALGAGASALFQKKPDMPAKPPLPNRDAAASAVEDSASYRKRRGIAATMTTGPGGAEAPSPGAKALLGQ